MRGRRYVGALRCCRRSTKNCGGKSFGAIGLRHYGVRKTYIQRSLDAKQKLDAFQTPDSQISIQRIVEARLPWRPPAEFGRQTSNDVEHLALDLLTVSLSSGVHSVGKVLDTDTFTRWLRAFYSCGFDVSANAGNVVIFLSSPGSFPLNRGHSRRRTGNPDYTVGVDPEKWGDPAWLETCNVERVRCPREDLSIVALAQSPKFERTETGWFSFLT
jgi:hypothetical protein